MVIFALEVALPKGKRATKVMSKARFVVQNLIDLSHSMPAAHIMMILSDDLPGENNKVNCLIQHGKSLH